MALLLVACSGSEVGFPGASGSGGGSSDGGGGVGGRSAPAASSSSAGGMGGEMAASSSSVGGAGGERPEPACPAPECLTQNPNGLLVNCDPACGPVHSTCKYCYYIPHPVIEQPLQLQLGINEIQLPPIAEQLFRCGLCDSDDAPIFSMWFRMPELAACMSATAPPGVTVRRVLWADDAPEPYDMCADAPQQAGPCPDAQIGTPPDFHGYMVIKINSDNAEQLPDGGSIVRVWLSDQLNGCVSPTCPTSCNGED